MDLYDEKEHIISSDEYSDEDEDEALMNNAVRAQYHNRSTVYTEQSKQPKSRIDQKQKELSSLIRRNKIFVIYKNKSIKWLNNKRKRERYKTCIYLNEKKNSSEQKISAGSSVDIEKQQNQNYKLNDQIYNTIEIQDVVSIEDDNNELIFSKPSKEIIKKKEMMQNIMKTNTVNYNDEVKNIQQVNEKQNANANNSLQEKKIDENLRTSIEKANEFPGKRTRSISPSIPNEGNETDVSPREKKFRTVSPQFYKNINDVFPKFDKIATNHIDGFVNTSLAAVENKIKSLANELETLNGILKSKEMEWNRLLHLKMVKEEIYSRLNKKWQMLQLKESCSKKEDQELLLELKELEFYLSEKKQTSENNHSSITIQKLIENRANMNADDLRREKNNTSRLHSLLVSQNMLHAAESLDKNSSMNNGDKPNMVLTSKNCEMYNYLDGGKIISNKGRQGEVRDVKSLIADFRQKNPELLPRVGKRIKSTESLAQLQSYSIPLFEKTSRAQYVTKDHQAESYLLPNSANEISITAIGRAKKLSNQDVDFVNAVNNHYNVHLEDKFIKTQMKADFSGKCSKNLQYPSCQECKSKESRFVCAGCGNQWYCSKKCQISAWDKHSDQCTE